MEAGSEKKDVPPDDLKPDSERPGANVDSIEQGETVMKTKLNRDFSVWGVLSVSWNIVNIFGGTSYIFVVGFSAGGIPAILYGIIGTSVGLISVIGILAECASIFPTAGGAYHFATFLAPERYRRYVGYALGWLNFLGWVLTIAACASIATGLTFSLAILTHPEYVVGGRWHLFLVYVGWVLVACLVNLYLFGLLDKIENVGFITNVLGFVGFTIALLVKAPKSSAHFVFVEVINETGYASSSIAVVLGLYNSLISFVALDAACHLAEEVNSPTKEVPKILWITWASQSIVGIIWITVIGFSIKELDPLINTPTGVPVVELMRQSLSSNGAAIVFNMVLLINYVMATTAATVTSSRQGYALARDGGLFFKSSLTKVDSKLKVPTLSVCLVSFVAILVGIVYLFSTQGFNAILGAGAGFMLLSYSSPALMMLIFGRKNLPKTPYSLGRYGYVFCVVSVMYGLFANAIVPIPGVSPVTATNMNYACLLYGSFFILIIANWILDARKSYHPPSLGELVETMVPENDEQIYDLAGQNEIAGGGSAIGQPV
ncbi:uncharacterized protein APUU_30105A [Aspergillus puulaauensis]|uniref:Amino acid transporter n=1 Tax=Aspergillus puulaauensis TaxID=1220207 RepID=A0A7R8ALN7_9EURO|nr:uncharacterized protein APUU_30105A [Aspergillus puulaauensis]BCS21880.1 hypothetical protein APUU_30105A [Aspergillus puulaauensis]